MRQNAAVQFFAILCAVSVVLLAVSDAEGRGRGGRGGGFNRGGVAAGGSFGHQRSFGGGNRMGNRNDRMNQRMDNRQDRYEDRRDRVDDYYDDRRDWVEDRQAVRVGAYLTASAFSAMSCSPSIVVVGGITYSQCGGDWYQRAYRGGSVTYVVVNAPAGY
jgi:hypothetical protein